MRIDKIKNHINNRNNPNGFVQAPKKHENSTSFSNLQTMKYLGNKSK
ncbi:MAG: hypothetical protein ACK5N8_08520 [Alphaproteobacteria bacterium]